MVDTHVLSNFTTEEHDTWLDPLLDCMARHLDLLLAEDDNDFMTTVARLCPPPKQQDTLMGFNCGIIGLPNVGKSTLFNALTESATADAANYPFCTIEPNTGRVAVPDNRLDRIAAIAASAQILPTQLEFVDIAGLVRGASKGEGLGNQFLGNIREVDAIIHVLRCFDDDNITHVDGGIDPA